MKEIAARERITFHPDRYAAYLPLFKQCTDIMLAQVGSRLPDPSDYDDFEQRGAVVTLLGSLDTVKEFVRFTNSLSRFGSDLTPQATEDEMTEIADAYESLRDCMRADLGGEPIAPIAEAGDIVPPAPTTEAEGD